MRVLIVAPPPARIGGQQIQAAGLVEHLGGGGSVRVRFQSITPRLPRPLAPLQRVKYVRTVVQSLALVALLLARAWRYDVVHVLSASHSSFAISTTPAILVARLYRRVIVLNYHSGGLADHLARWRRTALPVMRLADAIVVPSESLAGAFARHGLPARVLSNAVDLDRFGFRERGPLRPLFLTSRALQPRYDVECVRREFALIEQRDPGARLVVAGDGPERPRLERLAGELGLRAVEFRGWVAPAAMGALYGAADVYLNGSGVDAAPLSLVEAGAAGLPIVTTDAAGMRDGATAIVVARGDHVALAAGAQRLLDDPELAARLIAAARGWALEHGWDVARARWQALYRELVDAG